MAMYLPVTPGSPSRGARRARPRHPRVAAAEAALPVLEELVLHLQDDLGDAADGVLAPVDVLDEALGRADLVLEVAPGLVVGVAPERSMLR